MTLINADQLDTSPPDWLVDGVFPRVGAGFVYGPRTWGKSLVIDDEAGLAVANGTGFFGRKVIQGPVVLCLGEGLYDAGLRKQARLAREQRDRNAQAAQIAARQGYEAAGLWMAQQPPYTDEQLFIWTEPFVLPVGAGGAITRTLQAAITSMRQIRPELVILDSFADFTGGLSISNDASANRSMLGLKAMVRELDCCVLAVAHPTEKGDKMLGAGRLGNAADFVIRIEPETGTAPGTPRSATLVSEKNKYGPPFEPFGYTIEPCAWHEPARDPETDELIPGADPVLLTSATVRQRDDDTATGGLRLPGTLGLYAPPALPVLIPVPDDRPVKRNGIKRTAFRATGMPAAPAPVPVPSYGDPGAVCKTAAGDDQEAPESAPGPAAGDEDDRAELVSVLISEPCGTCSAPAGEGCDPHITAGGLVQLGSRPLVLAHGSRLLDAYQRLSTDQQEQVRAQFLPGNVPAALTEAAA